MDDQQAAGGGPVDAPATAAIRTAVQTVEPGWIDYNGHMNVAYYTLAFDRALDEVYERLGIGPGLVARARMGPMALQTQIHYLAELLEGERFYCEAVVLDGDAKRCHSVMTMLAAETGTTAAVYETLSMNVDLRARRSAPYPAAEAARLAAQVAAHAGLPRPPQVGRTIGIRRRP
ncbi:MAG: thioesterase family protein [Pseudomonadota bacterium]